MGFDDLYKQRRHENEHHNDHGYYGGHRDDHHDRHGIGQYLYLFEKLKSNRKLLIALSVVAFVLVILTIVVAIMLIPFLLKLLGAIQKTGISGLIETAKPLLELLLSGTGK